MPRQYKRMSPEPQMATWIIAADAGRARIFEAADGNGALTEIDDLVNSAARLSAQAVQSDRAGGATAGRHSTGGTFETRETPEEHNAAVFARRLCRRLSEARRAGRLGRLYLLAEPAFLGLLRKHLDGPTKRLVSREKATDLVAQTPAKIRSALPAHL